MSDYYLLRDPVTDEAVGVARHDPRSPQLCRHITPNLLVALKKRGITPIFENYGVESILEAEFKTWAGLCLPMFIHVYSVVDDPDTAPRFQNPNMEPIDILDIIDEQVRELHARRQIA